MSRTTREPNLYAIVDCLIISQMAGVELIEAVVLRVPDVVSYHLQIVCSFANGVLVESVKAGLVNDIDDSLFGLCDGER